MTNILLCGCHGRMGRVIASLVAQREDCRIAAGVDTKTAPADFPVFASPTLCDVPVDVVIDFSHPTLLNELLDVAAQRHWPAVICTTGIDETGIARIDEAAKTVPVLFSGNMSLGINLLMELAKKAAQVLGDSFDVEIVEKHHNQKLDAPSGTALMLANAVKDGLSYEPSYVYDRHAVRQKRDPHEVGIASLRGGTIVGEHEVMFAGKDEILTLSHSARSRDIFAVGAVNAALFLAGMPAGRYSMADVVK